VREIHALHHLSDKVIRTQDTLLVRDVLDERIITDVLENLSLVVVCLGRLQQNFRFGSVNIWQPVGVEHGEQPTDT
jgi:hypothetical protein